MLCPDSETRDSDDGGISLVTRLAAHATNHPNRPCLIWLDKDGKETERVSYGEIWREVCAVSSRLRKDDKVLLIFTPGLEFLIAFVACLRAGAVAMPVYPPDPRKPSKAMELILHMCKTTGCKLALINPEYKRLKQVQRVVPGTPSFPKDLHFAVVRTSGNKMQTHETNPFESAPADQEALAFIQFTSGSTGLPKGVMISHRALLSNLKALIQKFQVTSDTVGMVWAPHYHDMGLLARLVGLFEGCTSVFWSPLSFVRKPLLWLHLVTKYRAALTPAPNFAFELCVRELSKLCQPKQKDLLDSLDLSCCTCWLTGAEPVRAHTIRAFTHAFSSVGVSMKAIAPTLGTAENVVLCTAKIAGTKPRIIRVAADSLSPGDQVYLYKSTALNRPSGSKSGSESSTKAGVVELVSNGTPARGIGVHIEVNDKLVPEGTVGEILVSGSSRASGYYGLQDATNKTFFSTRVNATRTGDLGFILDGEVYICGRIKDVLIVRGCNLYPHDLELAAFESDKTYIRGGCVVAFQVQSHDEGQDEVVLVVEVRTENKADFPGVVSAIRGAIPDVGTVALVRPHTIPKTSSGKLCRLKCANLYREGKLPSGQLLFVSSAKKLVHSEPTGPRQPEEELGSESTDLNELSECSPKEALLLARVRDIMDDPKATPMSNLLERGLTSVDALQVCAAVESICDTPVSPEILERATTVRELLQEVADVEQQPLPEVNSAALVELHATRLPWPVVVLTQAVGVLLVFLALSTAVLPAYYLGNLALAVPTWMISFTAIVVVTKWLVVGRYRERIVPMDSLVFLRWWWVDRLVAVWEIFVGTFIMDTVLLSIVYKLMGARVAWSAQLSSMFREFDLVRIGTGSSLGGGLMLRQFKASDRTLRFRRVIVGKECKVETGAVVMLGSVLAQGTRLLPMSVLQEGSYTEANAEYHLNPARRAGPRNLTASASAVPHCKAMVLRWTVQALAMAVTAAMLFITTVPLITAAGSLSVGRYGGVLLVALAPMVGGVFIMLPLAVVLKWLLVGRARPGTSSSSQAQRALRVSMEWFVDYQFRITFFLVWRIVHDYAGAGILWLRLYGARIGKGAVWTGLPRAKVSRADLYNISKDAFISFSALGQPCSVGERAEIGLLAVLDDGVTVDAHAKVGPMVYVQEGSHLRPRPVDPSHHNDGKQHLDSGSSSPETADLDSESAPVAATPYALCDMVVPVALAGIMIRFLLYLSYVGCVLPAFKLAWYLLFTSALPRQTAIVLCGGALTLVLITFALWTTLLNRMVLGRNRSSPSFKIPMWLYVLTQNMAENNSRLLLHVLHGTVFLSWYFRLQGATVGRGVYLNCAATYEEFLHKYGDGCIVDEHGAVMGHQFINHRLEVGRVCIAPYATVHAHALVLPGANVKGDLAPLAVAATGSSLSESIGTNSGT